MKILIVILFIFAEITCEIISCWAKYFSSIFRELHELFEVGRLKCSKQVFDLVFPKSTLNFPKK